MDLRHAVPRTLRPATLLALILQIPLILPSAPSLALGLGTATHKTALGYPLSVEIPIVDRSDSLDLEQLRVRQVLGSDARQLGYDLAATAPPLSISVSELPGGPAIQVKSPKPLYEPFVSFVLELSWPDGTLYRNYNLLVDLPPAAPVQPTSPSTSPSTRSATRANPVDTDKSRSEWRVATGQSLWGIARRVQPDRSIPLETVMAVIHARNPHAFLNGDMSHLLAGAVLDLPGLDDYSTLPAGANHTAAAPEGAASRERSAPAETSPSSAVRTREKPQGRLRLSGSPLETSRSHTAHLVEELDAMKELLDKVNRENEQLRQQIQRIEASEYLAVMQEMLQLQEQRISELKAQLPTVPATRAAVDNAGTTPAATSAAAAPAPVVVRDAGPSYTALLLLALACIAGGVALSQLLAWRQRRRIAAELSPGRRVFPFDPLNSHWRSEFPPPAPEAEHSGMGTAGAEERGPEGAASPAIRHPDGLSGEHHLHRSRGEDSGDLSAKSSLPGDNDPVLDFAAIDQLPPDETDPAIAGPISGVAESPDDEAKNATSEESEVAAAGGEGEYADDAGSADYLFGELQLDESFDQDPAYRGQGSLPGNEDLVLPSDDDLVLEFSEIDQVPLDETDTACGAEGSGDTEVKSAVGKSAV